MPQGRDLQGGEGFEELSQLPWWHSIAVPEGHNHCFRTHSPWGMADPQLMSLQSEPLAFTSTVYLYANTTSFLSDGNAEIAGGVKLKGMTAGLGESTQFEGWISAVPSRAQCIYRGHSAPKDHLAALEEKYKNCAGEAAEYVSTTDNCCWKKFVWGCMPRNVV